MLKNKWNENCVFSYTIIFIWLSVLFLFPFITFILAVIYFKTDVSVKNILKKTWIYDCLWLEKITKAPWNRNWKWRDIEIKKTRYDYIREARIKNKDYKVNNFDFLVKENSKKENTRNKLKREAKNTVINKWNNLRSKNYEFNSWKSIWDDYESVLDRK